MFNLGFSEVVLLAVIALIFIGPKQLPDIARSLGRFLNELKRTSSEIGQTIASPTSYVKDRLDKEINEIHKSIGSKPRANSSDRPTPEEPELPFATDNEVYAHEDSSYHDESHAHDDHFHHHQVLPADDHQLDLFPEMEPEPEHSTHQAGVIDEQKKNS